MTHTHLASNLALIVYPCYTLTIPLEYLKEQFFAKKVEEYRIFLYMLAYIKIL